MLTPDELLGLAGRSLDGRLRRALHALPPPAVAALERRLKRDATEAGLVYEHEERIETIRVLPRPLVLLPEQLAYLHHVTLQVVDALERLPRLYLTDPHARRILRLSEGEDAFLRDVYEPRHAANNPLYPRLDAVVDLGAGAWRDTLKFVEANLSGVGGIHIAPVAEQLVWRDVVPYVTAHDPTLRLALPRDQRQLFLQVLLDHARAVGRAGGTICLLEPKYVSGGPVEQSHLARHLRERFDVRVVHADPRELMLRDGEVWCGDERVGVAYRDYEVRDLVALARDEGVDLAPVRELFRQNRMVSSVGGDFDHKSAFELLTDPEFVTAHFSPEERRIFARHVLWTRVVSDRRTPLPDGSTGDLAAYVRAARESLVLKPNRGYGGSGILLGPSTSEADWDAAVAKALAAADDPHGSWVAQALTALPVNEFPVLDENGHVHDEPFYTVMGFAPTDGGLGILCRASQKQVVNVAQRGGVVAVLLGEAPRALHGPPSVGHGDELAPALRNEIRTLLHLDATIELLGWDEETYLPGGGRRDRGEQLAVLESVRNAHLASPWLGDLLTERKATVPAGSPEAVELVLLERRRAHALAVPDALVREFAEARSASLAAWEEARALRDHRAWVGPLDRLLRAVRERAHALARVRPGGESAYDALLDQFDPGLTRARITPVLVGLRDALVPLVARLASDAPLPPWRTRPLWPDAKQDRFARELLTGMGFDFTRGRLDRSTHPFTLAAGPNDVRLTIRASEKDPFPAIFGTLHEGGHGLYDQGYAPEHHGTLLASSPGMALHESQARLWENLVGRSRPFWTFWFRRLRDRFADAVAGVDLDTFLAEINRVRTDLVRVSADEVSYNLHVLMRYRLEVELFDGALGAGDLAAAWNEQALHLFGRVPQDDLEGCLQDVHWAIGSFGYFPSYALGNLYAAQLYETWLADRPDGEACLARGELQPLLGFLRARVHAVGHLYDADEVVRRATGRGLSTAPFVTYLERKYLRG